MQKNDNTIIVDMLQNKNYAEAEKFYLNNNLLCEKWMDEYIATVWKKLSPKARESLFKRFDIPASKNDAIENVLDAFGTPIVPLSFMIASGHLAGADITSLSSSNPYIHEGSEIISYDEDNWGIFRVNKPFYGIFKNTKMTEKEQKYFEKLFISSASLDKSDKNRVLRLLATLSSLQLENLSDVFEEEKNKFHIMQIDHKEDLIKLRKRAETAWMEVEKELWFYMKITKENVKKMLDKDKDFTPYAIEDRLKASVKGQDIAVRQIATALYYQTKVHYAYTKDKKIPHKPFDPILLSGSTGSGKSFLLKTGCEFLDLPFLHVDASSLVSAGIRGYCMNDVMKDIIRAADYDLKKAETSVIVFDEVDKLTGHYDGQSILNQLLRVVEGSGIPLDKNSSDEHELSNIRAINTEKILFVFAGSFQGLLDDKSNKSGFIQSQERSNNSLGIDDIEKTKLPKELLGRIGNIVILNKLKRDELREILLNSKASPLRKYKDILAVYNVSCNLNENEIENILDYAESSSYGARALNQILNQMFNETLFNAPSRHSNRDIDAF